MIKITKLVPMVLPAPHHVLPVLPLDVDLQQVVVAVDELLWIPDTQHQRLALSADKAAIFLTKTEGGTQTWLSDECEDVDVGPVSPCQYFPGGE